MNSSPKIDLREITFKENLNETETYLILKNLVINNELVEVLK